MEYEWYYECVPLFFCFFRWFINHELQLLHITRFSRGDQSLQAMSGDFSVSGVRLGTQRRGERMVHPTLGMLGKW